MILIAQESRDYLVFAAGSDEAAILLHPGSLLRRVLDKSSLFNSRARFLTFAGGGDGMLAVLPWRAAGALIALPALHPVERELQELLFDTLAPDRFPLLLENAL